MDSNIYSAAPHIPLKRLNLSSLIVALLSKKTPCQMKRHQRQSAAPWWETWAVPPDEFSQWPPMSQLFSDDSGLYEEVRAREMSIGSNSNLPCGRQFIGRENNIKSPFSNIEQRESHSTKSGCHCKDRCYTTKEMRYKFSLLNRYILNGNRINKRQFTQKLKLCHN